MHAARSDHIDPADICQGARRGDIHPSAQTIPADIGTRLVTTGYVIAVFSGMADIFGFGTQLKPRVPFFGPWQSTGVQIGEAVIAIGFLLLIPYHRHKNAPEE